MKYLLGHTTALDYWRTHERPAQRHPTRAKPRFIDPPSAAFIQRNSQALSFATPPLHFVVSERIAMRKSESVVCHYCSDIPAQSFLSIAPNVYISSPEECFLQVASELDLMGLIGLGFELCGSYALIGNTMLDRLPRTTTTDLRRHIELSAGRRGTKAARTALPYVLDGSCSPMETKLALLLTLPTRYGGYGLPKPRMNSNLPNRAKAQAFRGDLYWPKARFSLEYDSDLHHSSAEKLHRDSRRRTAIELSDVHTISVTKRQVYNAQDFDDLARVTARHLGIRLRTERADFVARRAQLRRRLLLDGQARSWRDST